MIARSLDSLNELAMQYGNDWNPMVARAYDIPHPQPGEAISSWLIRYAIRKNCSLAKIVQLIGGNCQKQIFWLDFDTEALPWKYLGKLMSFSPESLQHLVPSRGQLLLLPQLVCLHTDPMRMLPQLRYCARCLATDTTPYYRNAWRLASTWICEQHGCVMREYCPLCHAPIFWDYGFRKRIKISDLRKCHHCGGDLCSLKEEAALPKWLTEEVIATQADFLDVLGFHKDEEDEINIRPIKDSTISRVQRETRAIETLIHNRFAKKNTPTLADAFENLTEIIRILGFPSKLENQELRIGVGIETNKLFGSATSPIYTALMQHQNPFGTTLWWPAENPLRKAQRVSWSLQDFDRTKEWVLRHINLEAGSPHKSDAK